MMSATVDTDQKGRVLCGGCKEPILADDLGGVGKGKDGREVWFHSALPCILAVSDMGILDNRHESDLKAIGREIKHGRPAIIKTLTEPPAGNPGSYEF